MQKRLRKLPNVGLQNKCPYNSIRMITAEEKEMGGACSAYNEKINVYTVWWGDRFPFWKASAK